MVWLVGPAPPQASPALLSVLWASLVRVPLRSAKGTFAQLLSFRAGGNPGGGANGNLTAKQSLESADIELCKEPEGDVCSWAGRLLVLGVCLIDLRGLFADFCWCSGVVVMG